MLRETLCVAGPFMPSRDFEAPAVILSDFEGLEEQRLRELFYVGITRAQDHLRISASVDAKEWIQKTFERRAK